MQLIEAGEVVAVDGPGDLCAARAALAGRSSGLLRALDDVHAWQIPRATLQALIAGNAGFSAWLFGGISHRLAAAAERRPQRELLSLMTAQVRDAYVRKPFYVDGALDLVSVCRVMSAQQACAMRWCATASASACSPPPTCATPCCGRCRRTQLAVREVARFELIDVGARRRGVRGAAG